MHLANMVQTCPTLEVCEVALLVEAGLVQAERVDDVDLGLLLVVGSLLLLLSGSIGTGVYTSLACQIFISHGSTHRMILLRQ